MSRLPHFALRYFHPKPPSLTIGAEINRGAYGTVHSGLLNGKPVAVKRIHILLLDAAKQQGDFDKMFSDFQRECQLLEHLEHPHVVGFKGAFYDSASEEPILVMELMSENLQTYLKDRKGKLSRQKQLQICVEIVRALRFLHMRSPPIMHRDLTDKNILLSSDGLIKIGDLGQSKWKTPDYFSTAQPGAIPFMPPEAMMPHSHYDEKIDIFSLGVLMLEIATQELPCVSLVGIGTSSELQRRHGDLSKLDQDHPLKQLILSCLKDDPKERPHIVEIHTQLLSMLEGIQLFSVSTAGSTRRKLSISASGNDGFQTSQLLEQHCTLRSLKLPDLPTATASANAIIIARNVYVCGGGCQHAANARLVQVYNINQNSWSTLPPAPQFNSEAAAIDNKLVLIGGADAVSQRITNLLSTWGGQKWNYELPAMPTRRIRPGVTTYSTIVIVAGGKADDNKTVLRSIDVLDTTTQQWWTPVNLQLPLPMFGLTITACGTDLYIGSALVLRRVSIETSPSVWKLPLSTVRNVLTSKDQSQPYQWTEIAHTPNYHSALLQGTAHLVAVGGCNALDQLATDIAVYNPRTNQWSTVDHLHTPRAWCTVVSFSRASFMVIGGCSDIRNVLSYLLSSVELIQMPLTYK